MIEVAICVLGICGWTLMIAENPISCNGQPVQGCTYFDMKLIVMDYWDACIFAHEVNEHTKAKNNVIHNGICR